MPWSRWTPEREAELTERWSRGERRKKIARGMGLTPGQIAGKALRLNLHYESDRKPPDIPPGSFEDIAGVSRFRHAVREPSDGVAVLKSGRDARKIGPVVTKGAWRGFPVFTLTLQERATCPRACAQWLSCYGNSMNFARRWQHGEALESRLWSELDELQYRHPLGFVVRLHLLGDFYSTGYVDFWHEALVTFPALHVFGYSAWPHHTKIGRAVKNLRDAQWDRFAVRTSGALSGPRTVVIEKSEDKPDGAIICPAQTGKTLACGTCGLCWAGAARERTVAFLRH